MILRSVISKNLRPDSEVVAAEVDAVDTDTEVDTVDTRASVDQVVLEAQVLVLDEYCARYNVRTCFRHLSYLDSLLDINEKQSYFIDHTLLNLCYDFCSSFVSGGNNLQVMSTTTTRERLRLRERASAARRRRKPCTCRMVVEMRTLVVLRSRLSQLRRTTMMMKV